MKSLPSMCEVLGEHPRAENQETNSKMSLLKNKVLKNNNNQLPVHETTLWFTADINKHKAGLWDPRYLCCVLGHKHTQRIKFLGDIKMRQSKLGRDLVHT